MSYEWRELKPWIMKRSSQFRPEPPPALTSAMWARDYNEIKATRRAEQRASARPSRPRSPVSGPPSAPPPGTPIARSVATAPGASHVDNARLFALANMAAADAFVAVFDAKYTFNLWRPVTAIRNGDLDGNDATERDTSLAAIHRHADASRVSLRPLHHCERRCYRARIRVRLR